MASPEPSASVLDPKPAGVVLDKESKAEVNGHTPALESALEASTEKPTEPPVETKAESHIEIKHEADRSSEKPLVNGDSSADGHSGTNGVNTNDVETKPAEPESKPSENSPATPAEAPKPAESEPLAENHKEANIPATETPVTEASVAEPPVADAQKASKQSAEEPTRSEDAEMTDATNYAESAAPEPAPVSKPASSTPAPSADPVPANAEGSGAGEDSNQDTEMVDKPEEPSSAEKPKDVDDSVPPSEDAVPTSEVDLHPASMSQLDLDPSQNGLNPAKSSIEVSMLDAPSKVAREREDDVGVEPAPKRAKTEPNEDEPAMDNSTIEARPASALAAQGSAELVPGTLATLPQWDDAEKAAQTITAFQRREMRRVMGRIKKTKHGNSFRDSVQKLWPGIWESYVAKIGKPMDLSEIDRGLRDSTYATIGQFKDDLALIYLNTLAFNGPAHDITGYALGAIRTTWEDVRRIPEEEPVKVKAVAKPKPVRESRAVATSASSDAPGARQSAGPAASPAGDAPDTKAQPVSAPQQAADARRASIVTEGDRPKRTVRAPKPKDIDYSTKSSRKKLKPELQFCEEVMAELFHPRNATVTQWFKEPVDAEGLGIPQYYSTIKKPMDLGTVAKLLARGDITSLKDFDKNVKLIFSNCYQFNGPPSQGNAVSALAHQLEELYLAQMKGKDAWLSKHAKANARQASTSNASDDEDEDGDDEGDAEDALGPDPSIEIKKLEARYQEENSKLNAIILSDNPTQTMIELQEVVMKAIQEALLKAKLSLTEYRQKQDKGGKRGGKPAKTKAAGTGRKSQGNASQPKKTGGSKKAAKKTLTAADKDQIANAINDLEGNQLDRAIEIIKRDTGQNENNDGELELDIDQLSNEALLKLWELCKRVLPGFAKDTAATTKSPEVNRAAAKQQQQNNAAKPKKNKPMSAQEQEARIAQLQNLSAMYRPGQGPAEGLDMVMDASPPAADSSDESSSEEE